MDHFVTLVGWVLRRPFLIEYHGGAPKVLTFGSSVEGIRDRPLRHRGGAVHHPMLPLDEGRHHQAPAHEHRAATWKIFIVITASWILISASSAASPIVLNLPRMSLLREHPLERESAMLGAEGMPRRRGSDSGNVLPFSRPPNRERTLEIHCDNCQARFNAWYGTEDDGDTDTIDVEKCGLCGGDPFKKDNFKDCVIRLIAQVITRNVKRGD